MNSRVSMVSTDWTVASLCVKSNTSLTAPTLITMLMMIPPHRKHKLAASMCSAGMMCPQSKTVPGQITPCL